MATNNPKPNKSSTAADPADIADYCARNGAGGLAAELIREGATMDEVREAVGAMAKIHKMVADARAIVPAIDPKLADSFIVSRASIEDVRAALFDKITAAQSPEIRGQISTDTGDPRARAQRGWDKALGTTANTKEGEIWR